MSIKKKPGEIHIKVFLNARWIQQRYKEPSELYQYLEKRKHEFYEIEDVTDVEVSYDFRDVCEFCGEEWIDWVDMPGCCEDAQKEWLIKQQFKIPNKDWSKQQNRLLHIENKES